MQWFFIDIWYCRKEPVLPYMGQNWHDVIECVLVFFFLFFLSVKCSYKGMYFWYIWQAYSTGITKKKSLQM